MKKEKDTSFKARNTTSNRAKNTAKSTVKSTVKNTAKSTVKNTEKSAAKNAGRKTLCPVSGKCGGCQHLDIPYEKQLEMKQKQLDELLKGICKVKPIIGMENPFYYRNKVHAVFTHDRKGNPISGIYQEGSHKVVPVETLSLIHI